MRTSELMLGDFVYETFSADAPSVVSVDEIASMHIYASELHDEASFRYDCEHIGFDIQHISPIPLTEQMLKDNGWEEYYFGHIEDEHHRYFKNGIDRRLEINLIDGCFCINYALGRLDFKYVHELQHALRLCGLYVMAYNFKIK